MAAILASVVHTYNDWFFEKADRRTEHMFLMRSPMPITGILILYYYFVKIFGPKWMEKRKPFNIDRIMVVYNAFQVIVNSWMVYEAFERVWFDRSYSFFCAPLTYSTESFFVLMTDRVHNFFLLKLSDLFDTVFMVLRKNFRQITFLHVYHHIGMAAGSWLATKYIASGHIIFFGTLNAFVHVVMYGYYLLTAYDPKYKKSIWWKKHITELQLAQFFLLFIHHTVTLLNPYCDYPSTLLIIYISQTILMIYLFSQFYYVAYLAPAKVKKTPTETK